MRGNVSLFICVRKEVEADFVEICYGGKRYFDLTKLMVSDDLKL